MNIATQLRFITSWALVALIAIPAIWLAERIFPEVMDK